MSSTPTGRRVAIGLAVIFCAGFTVAAVTPISPRSIAISLAGFAIGIGAAELILWAARPGSSSHPPSADLLALVVAGVVVGSGGAILTLLGPDGRRAVTAIVAGLLGQAFGAGPPGWRTRRAAGACRVGR